LLAFLPEYFGFKRYKILGLQESAELLREAAPSMFDVLSGVSPDYAVVAQKEGPPEIMDALNPPFVAEYGLSLKVLADTYQQQLDVRTKQAERHIQELAEAADRWVRQAEQAVADAKARASEAEARMMAAEARAHQAEERVRLAEGSVHLAEERANAESARAHQVAERAPLIEARADHAESRARAAEFRAKEHEHQQLALALQLEQQRAKIEELGVHTHHWWQSARVFEAECSALRNSWSWRLTAPLRMGATLAVRFWAEVHKGVNLAIFGGIHVLQRPLSRVMAAVLRRPELSHRIGQWLLRFPYLHQQLVAVARRRGVVPSFDTPPPSAAPVLDKGPVEVLENLTPRARQIHRDLQKALKNKR
jgi:O-antigen chain-terminating methyltransferase